MRKVFLLLTAIMAFGVVVQRQLPASAAYRLSTSAPYTWDGADANRLKTPTDDYKHTYGDEASLTYNLPWPFTFYGQTYSQGNIKGSRLEKGKGVASTNFKFHLLFCLSGAPRIWGYFSEFE